MMTHVILFDKIPSKVRQIAFGRFQNLKISPGSIPSDPPRLIPSQQQLDFSLDPPCVLYLVTMKKKTGNFILFSYHFNDMFLNCVFLGQVK